VEEEEEPPKKETPPARSKSAEEAFTFNFKGEKYPLKYMLWSYLKNHKLKAGNEVSRSFETSDLYLTIQETFPLLILNDHHYFIGAALTTELWSRIKASGVLEKNFSKFCDLRQVRIKVARFKLQLRQVNSKEVFTSFGSLELRLVIEDCEILFNDGPYDRKYTNSVFKDEEIRSILLTIFHSAQLSYLEGNFKDLPLPANVMTDEDETWKGRLEQPQSEGSVLAPPDQQGIYSVFEFPSPQKLDVTEIADIITEEKGLKAY